MFIKTKNEIIKVINNLNSGNNDFTFFISPAGYTLIKTYFDNNNLDYGKLKFNKESGQFLNLLGFFDGSYKISNYNKRKILPLRTIYTQNGDDIEKINNEFSKILRGFLENTNELHINNISSIIGELLNNISHHSGEKASINDDTGEVIISSNYQSGQYYDKKSLIQISIVDSGIGILSSVRKKIPEIQLANKAIEKALEAGFTGGTTLNPNNKNFSGIFNRGIGLPSSLEMIKKLKGDLFIGTKDSLFCYNGENNNIIFEKIDNWKGTFVVFNIYTNKTIETVVDFENLKKELLSNTDLDIELEKSIDFS